MFNIHDHSQQEATIASSRKLGLPPLCLLIPLLRNGYERELYTTSLRTMIGKQNPTALFGPINGFFESGRLLFLAGMLRFT